MSAKNFGLTTVVLWAVVTLSTSTVFAADMFSGTWKENISKSTYQSGPVSKQPTIQKVDSANGLRVERDSVLDNGQKVRSEYSLKFDGKEYFSRRSVGCP
jgi:hypothetical protein